MPVTLPIDSGNMRLLVVLPIHAGHMRVWVVLPIHAGHMILWVVLPIHSSHRDRLQPNMYTYNKYILLHEKYIALNMLIYYIKLQLFIT